MGEVSKHKNLALQPPKAFYLHYHNASGCQTWQGSYLPWRVPDLKSYDHFILSEHLQEAASVVNIFLYTISPPVTKRNYNTTYIHRCLIKVVRVNPVNPSNVYKHYVHIHI